MQKESKEGKQVIKEERIREETLRGEEDNFIEYKFQSSEGFQGEIESEQLNPKLQDRTWHIRTKGRLLGRNYQYSKEYFSVVLWKQVLDSKCKVGTLK